MKRDYGDRRRRRLPQNGEETRKEILVNRLDMAGQIGFVVGLLLLGASVLLPMRSEFIEVDPLHELLALLGAVLATGSLVMILGTMGVRFSVDWGTAPWRISLRGLVVLVAVVGALFTVIVVAVQL